MVGRTTQQATMSKGLTARFMTEPSDPSIDQTPEPPETSQNKPVLKRTGVRACLYTMAFCMLLLAACLGGLYYAVGRTFELGDWAKTRAAAQFSDVLPEADVHFDSLSIEIEKEWHPRIRLGRVIISPKSGAPEIELSEVETSLSYRRLLKREIAPRDFRVNGVILQMRREAEGQIGVSVGSGTDTQAQNTALNQLVHQIDSWLQLPQFSQLRTIDIDAVTVRFEDLRAGRGWTVDGGQMRMLRQDEALRLTSQLALLGGRDYVSTLDVDYTSQIGSLAAQLDVAVTDVAADDIASQSPALAWLDIIDAPISGAMRVSVDEEGALGPLTAELAVENGVFQPGDGLRPVPFETARTAFSYSPESNRLDFEELLLNSAWGRVRAEGKALLDGDSSALPEGLVAQFVLTELSGNPAGLFDQDVAFEKIQTDFRLRFDPFEITLGEMFVQDDEQSLVVDGKVTATQDDWIVALNARTQQMDVRRLVALWPENAAAKTRTWLDENLLEGHLKDVNFALRSQPKERPEIYLDFKFDEAKIRYAKTLPIIEQGWGQAQLLHDRFTVLAHGGYVSPGQGGAIDIAGTSFVIPNTRQKPADAEIALNTYSSVTAALALLDTEPLSLISKANLPVDLADGLARVDGSLRLPLVKGVKPEQFAFAGKAQVTDVRTSHFTKDHALSAQVLNVDVDNDGLQIVGAGLIGAIPFDGVFSTKFGPENDGKSQVRGTVELGERFVDQFNIGLSRDVLRGRTTGNFALDFTKGSPGQFEVTSDLNGTSIGVDAIGWRKSANQSGSLKVAGRLTTPVQVDTIELDTAGLTAAGDTQLNADGTLNAVRLSSVRVGNWLRGAANLVGRGDSTPRIQITGGTLDMRNTPSASGAAGGGGASAENTPIEVSLDRLTVSEGITLTGFNGEFDTLGGFNGEFTSAVNGGARISGVVVPQSGRSAVRIRSDDAGGTLRGAGVVEQTHGGTLDLTLVPVGAPGNYQGQLAARNMRVKDAPAMAELLNAMSVVGLLDQLGGDGIAFTEVDARFNLSPDRVELLQGSAVGPSMGLSMDGNYDLKNSVFNMQGVISPVYILNVIGRPIARKGEGLIGFNYSLTGSSDQPSVRVNPLSVLTPGILRDIFRRPQSGGTNDSTPTPEPESDD